MRINAYDDLLENALTTFGKDAQLCMAMEELSELSQAINKYFNRGLFSVSEIVTEIADVELCLAQVIRIMPENSVYEYAKLLQTDKQSTHMREMMLCGDAMVKIHDYFVTSECSFDDLEISISKVINLCNVYREVHFGDDIVDEHIGYKILRLRNIIAESNNEDN